MPGINPVVSDVVEVLNLCSAGFQTGQNTLHYAVSGVTGGGLTLQQIAIQLSLVFAPLYKALMPSGANFRGVGATNLAAPRSQQFFDVTGFGPGTFGTTLVPTQVRGVIAYYSTLAGPKNRGRSYIPFPPTTAVATDGSPLPSYLAALTNLRTAIAGISTLTVGGATTTLFLVIAHKPHTPGNWATVVATYGRSKWGTQRRSGMYGRQNVPPF